MLRCTEQDGALTFSVRVVPRASRSGVAGEHDGSLRVRVAAPPVEGAANAELVRTLARAFRVPARDVSITSGHTSKLKHVRVQGVTREALEALLQEASITH
ncbi:MAG: YggU family protein [Acidobacteria bacterium]|nr:YggU family protein [Acidobacteriota bacterium]